MESNQNSVEVSAVESSFTEGKDIQKMVETNDNSGNNLEKTEEEKQTEKCYEDFESILNGLTPQSFKYSMESFLKLPIDTEEKLNGVTNLVFEKAVNDSSSTRACANVCKVFCLAYKDNKQKLNFLEILLTKCQREFEAFVFEKQNTENPFEEIKPYKDTDKGNENKRNLTLKKIPDSLFKRQSGIVRFFGELSNCNILSPMIILKCMNRFIDLPEDTSVKYLYTLLTTSGKILELQGKYISTELNAFFTKISTIVQNSKSSIVSVRGRGMLQELIKMRQNKWVSTPEFESIHNSV